MKSAIFSLCGLSCALLTGGVLQAGTPGCPDVGTVVSHTKISETQGGFGGVLDSADFFGAGVELLGDLNGDGTVEVAVGANQDDDGGTNGNLGAVYILSLNETGQAVDEVKISATSGGFQGYLNNNDAFGTDIAAIGDLDNDGVTDIAVGAEDDGNNTGELWIMFLNDDGTVREATEISSGVGGFTGSLNIDDHFGNAVTGLGDLDGDGVEDIAVGANGHDADNTNDGAVWIFFMNTDGTVKSHVKITGSVLGVNLGFTASFGVSLEYLGDLAGDGTHALAVGSFVADGGTGRGGVFILFLDNEGQVLDYQRISDTEGGFEGVLDDVDQFSISIASLGDIDGDGVADIAAGASADDDGGGSSIGAVWLLFLNENGTVKADRKISDTSGGFTGELDDSDLFGYSVGCLGDLNSDGMIELAVGAIGDDDGETDAGAVWILSLETCVQPPVITDQPDSILLPAGANQLESFTVVATGDEPLTYQWRRDGVELDNGGPILGVTTSVLTVFASADTVGEYDCVVTNDFGTVVSDIAVLALRPSCPGDSDSDGDIDFADLNLVLSGFGTLCTP